MISSFREEISSPEDTELNDDNQIITVKFKISESQIIAQVYPISITLTEVKKDIGIKFDIDPNYLKICRFDEELSDDCRLSDINTNEFGIIEFDLNVNQDIVDEKGDTKKPELDLQIYYSKFRLADFITVHIPVENSSDGIAKDIVVEIQNQAITKPFLGGYRNTKTGIEYLDAYTQTGPSPNKIKTNAICSRNVQTVELRDKASDTPCDISTQSFGDANHLINISSSTDYIIIPRKYESFKEKCRRENKDQKIRLIQRNWRRYLLWRYIKKCAAEYRRRVNEENQRQNQVIEHDTELNRKECITKIFPRTKEDFDLLYAQVQKWKEQEVKRINSAYSGASRTAKLGLLLDKEVQLLNNIEKKKSLVKKALKEYHDEKKLKKLGEPVKWIGYNDTVVEMDLLRTQKVRFLTELYKEMRKNLDIENRIRLLDRISDVLESEGHLPEIYELLELFEREKSLLILLNNKCSLEVLRNRELALFMEIIKHYRTEKQQKEERRMCEKCRKVKSIKDFALRTRQNTINTCKRCFYLKGNISDNSLYTAILRVVQRDEKSKGSLASYAFIMQEDDIRYIIHVIWHGHSILSKCNDISRLRLPRWIKSEEWSPWNCICITEVEARAHVNITNLNDVYTDTIIQDINAKHIIAKNAFKKLKEIDRDYVESGEWWEIGVKEKVV